MFTERSLAGGRSLARKNLTSLFWRALGPGSGTIRGLASAELQPIKVGDLLAFLDRAELSIFAAKSKYAT